MMKKIIVLTLSIILLSCHSTEYVKVTRYPPSAVLNERHFEREFAFLMFGGMGVKEFINYKRYAESNTHICPVFSIKDRDSIQKLLSLIHESSPIKLPKNWYASCKYNSCFISYDSLWGRPIEGNTCSHTIDSSYKNDPILFQQSRIMWIDYEIILASKAQQDTLYIGNQNQARGFTFLIKNGVFYLMHSDIIDRLDTLFTHYFPKL